MKSKLGIWEGVRAFFGGCGFVITTPRIWGWAMVPVLVALVLGGALGTLGVWGASKVAGSTFSGESGWAEAARWVLGIVLAIVALLVAFVIAISLSQPLSGFALDRIVRAQAQALGSPVAQSPNQSLGLQLKRSLGVSLTALAIGLPLIALLTVVELVAAPAAVVTIPLKFVVSGLMLSWDFLDYPLGADNATVGDRVHFMRDNLGAVTAFGLLASVTLLVPGLGLLLLPMGAAGATRLVIGAATPAPKA
jgi:CysZ protein